MNYGELKAVIADYMHRNDLTPAIEGFIELTRQRINRDLRAREMIVALQITPVVNPSVLPPDFLEMRDLYHSPGGRRVTMTLVGRKQLNDYANANGVTPQFYSVDGTALETAPGGVNTLFNMQYFAAEAAFTDDSDERETLTTYPSIWLYGCLIEANSYVQDLTLKDQATGDYVSEVQRANLMSKSAEAAVSLQIQGASQWH